MTPVVEHEFEDLQVRRKTRMRESGLQTIYVLYRVPSGEPLEGIYANEQLARDVAMEIAVQEKVTVWVQDPSDEGRFVRLT